MDLNTLAFMLLTLLAIAYAILDGFDLGVGALSLWARDSKERDLYVAAVGPVWDGNEVWLLAVGDVLFGAFPLVFATVFSGFYLAVMLLLVALVARGVAIEFRRLHPSSRWLRFWDWAFGWGSLVTALLLGTALGNVLRGVPIGAGFVWQGSFFGLLHPYALLIGALTVALFIMHGALYLWMKTEGELSQRLGRTALRAYGVFAALYIGATAATVYVSPFLFQKTNRLTFWILTALLIAALGAAFAAMRRGKKEIAFIVSSALIALMLLTAAYSAYPLMVPSLLGPELSLTFYNAASTPGTLALMLIIALIGIPLALGYTYVIYRVFRGPVRGAEY